jgi:hypothetical protein
MYNLEVARANSFSVGSSGWIVHNADDGFRKLNPYYKELLEAAGFDLETMKKEVLGSNAKVSKFDLFVDKEGNIVVKPKNGMGPGELLGNFGKILGICGGLDEG